MAISPGKVSGQVVPQRDLSVILPRISPTETTVISRKTAFSWTGHIWMFSRSHPLDECFHPEHPVSRRECKEFRGKCFDYIRRHWGIVSSEEPADWAIPHLDTVHHAPWPLFPNPGAGPAMGIPIPLFNLVYHDALVIPWSSRRNSRGDWGHDENSIPFLSGLLNGGIPYVPWNADAGKIREISVMRDLHRKVALEEMVSHEFCSEDCKVQKTVFSDETEVLVNHTDGSWKIN